MIDFVAYFSTAEAELGYNVIDGFGEVASDWAGRLPD